MSRAMKPVSVIKIERLGKVCEYSLFKKPVEGTDSEQAAYRAGFQQRVSDFNQGIDGPETPRHRRTVDKNAYLLGYADAKAQEPQS